MSFRVIGNDIFLLHIIQTRGSASLRYSTIAVTVHLLFVPHGNIVIWHTATNGYVPKCLGDSTDDAIVSYKRAIHEDSGLALTML